MGKTTNGVWYALVLAMKQSFKKISLFITFMLCLCFSACTQQDGGTDKQNYSVNGNTQTHSFSLEDIPEFSGSPYVIVNENIPDFDESEYTTVSFESYGEPDSLGRCTTAYANVGKDIMPTEERGAIGMIKPSGWHTVKYDFVDGKYLYNRCHLIGYQLTGENDNEKNLITGTRYMNVQGMLPFEDMVADYVEETGNHVLYRVTPVFQGENLLADGVHMEGRSVEDEGKGICFNVFVYNSQPGVEIDYATGDSRIAESRSEEDGQADTEYILNTNSHKFHYPDCSGVKNMSEKNKQVFKGSREEVIAQGYEPCERCNP